MMIREHFSVTLISLCLIGFTHSNERCVSTVGVKCPPAWSQRGDQCYRKFSENLPWAKAKEECIKMGSVLVMPQSQEETEFLQNNVYHWFWINCNDIEVNGWWKCQDSTANVEYTNWGVNQPSNGKGENCAVVTDIGVWNDVKCENRSPVICKRPAPMLHF